MSSPPSRSASPRRRAVLACTLAPALVASIALALPACGTSAGEDTTADAGAACAVGTECPPGSAPATTPDCPELAPYVGDCATPREVTDPGSGCGTGYVCEAPADAGVDAAGPQGFTHWLTLDPLDPVVICQGVAADLGMTKGVPDLYGLQAEKVNGVENATVTRFVGGKPTERMRFPGGGHGWEFTVVRRNNAPYVRFEHEIGMVEVPWRAGTSVSAAQAKAFKVAALPAAKPPVGDWLQGRVIMPDLSEWRLYGVPFHPPPRLNGDNPNIPGRLEYLVKAKIVETIDVRHLGRTPLTPTGMPIDKRLEPEGLSLVVLDGVTRMMIGVVTGSVNKPHKIQLYTAPLAEIQP